MDSTHADQIDHLYKMVFDELLDIQILEKL